MPRAPGRGRRARMRAAAALCGTVGHAAADAEDCLAGIDCELPGLFTTSEL